MKSPAGAGFEITFKRDRTQFVAESGGGADFPGDELSDVCNLARIMFGQPPFQIFGKSYGDFFRMGLGLEDVHIVP